MRDLLWIVPAAVIAIYFFGRLGGPWSAAAFVFLIAATYFIAGVTDRTAPDKPRNRPLLRISLCAALWMHFGLSVVGFGLVVAGIFFAVGALAGWAGWIGINSATP